MASVLRQCLKDPYREAALAKEVTYRTEKVWANGAVQSKVAYNDYKTGFEAQGAGGADSKK
eukprot:CAMPEP_0179275252 /NCGR_PEP_ID=MMETSP0797-20121207/33966_1 /TAXON_ID=47934 /ORGANISM="Dinophysis acuminata, Strain DAEP01" /LENGTH=60 /DNA_ID=CAMNT_0020983771 /DNA_START=1 /DNA_END=183 /DNA_ORIENTATION=+